MAKSARAASACQWMEAAMGTGNARTTGSAWRANVCKKALVKLLGVPKERSVTMESACTCAMVSSALQNKSVNLANVLKWINALMSNALKDKNVFSEIVFPKIYVIMLNVLEDSSANMEHVCFKMNVL